VRAEIEVPGEAERFDGDTEGQTPKFIERLYMDEYY